MRVWGSAFASFCECHGAMLAEVQDVLVSRSSDELQYLYQTWKQQHSSYRRVLCHCCDVADSGNLLVFWLLVAAVVFGIFGYIANRSARSCPYWYLYIHYKTLKYTAAAVSAVSSKIRVSSYRI